MNRRKFLTTSAKALAAITLLDAQIFAEKKISMTEAYQDLTSNDIFEIYWTKRDLDFLYPHHDSETVRTINKDLRRDHHTQRITLKQGPNLEDFLGHIKDIKHLVTGGKTIEFLTKEYLYHKVAEDLLKSTRKNNTSKETKISFQLFTEPKTSTPVHELHFPPKKFFEKQKYKPFLPTYNQELKKLATYLGFDSLELK
jgi:hypothetical protein